MSAELQRLRALEPQLADAQAGREHAEALVGRQRVEIDSLETASRELQRMLGEQASRINHMASELHRLRAHIPTDEDAAALESMAALLTTARAGGRGKQRPAHTESVQVMHLTEQSARPLSGPALARQQRDRMHAEAREREQREQEQREQRELDREQEPSALMDQHEHQVIVIPAEPTPFAQLANRRAA